MSHPLQGRHPRLAQGLFGLAVILLALLATWWFYFLAGSVSREDAAWRENVALHERLAALELSTRGGAAVGPVESDERLHVAPADGSGSPIAGTGLEVQLLPGYLAEHDRWLASRKAMIYGEGAFLLLLVLTCVVMLYRLVLSEQRYRRDIESFLSRVTHEMKTPLAGLKALLQTMRAGRVPEDRLRELAEMGLRQAEREEHLIENLLLAHRLATSREPLVTADIDLRGLLSDFAAHRVSSMGESEGRLEIRCPQSVRVRVHAGACGTILENLADNAYKYGATRLTIEPVQEGDRVRVTLTDDGMGFDPSHAEALFQPFQREASGTAGRHGTGLGLPIARELAREQGGDLLAESDGPGSGARFVLILPSAPASAGAPERAPAESRA